MTTLIGIDPGLAATGWGVVRFDGARFRHVAHGVLLWLHAPGGFEAKDLIARCEALLVYSSRMTRTTITQGSKACAR